ncbi:hypothetical protein TNIN_129441 [Trichonephila inaurata madagascariensis]|uniref:Uncharacterized protein n=1 Tax=Trichonephila inaurata madagascariensis TaxID=2747483 RepID=A0A8X6YKD0_9ARAC|nr:hypothetical protein TNIN_129441 [Trichonephila inaurata madagascariensis]
MKTRGVGELSGGESTSPSRAGATPSGVAGLIDPSLLFSLRLFKTSRRPAKEEENFLSRGEKEEEKEMLLQLLRHNGNGCCRGDLRPIPSLLPRRRPFALHETPPNLFKSVHFTNYSGRWKTLIKGEKERERESSPFSLPSNSIFRACALQPHFHIVRPTPDTGQPTIFLHI